MGRQYRKRRVRHAGREEAGGRFAHVGLHRFGSDAVRCHPSGVPGGAGYTIYRSLRRRQTPVAAARHTQHCHTAHIQFHHGAGAPQRCGEASERCSLVLAQRRCWDLVFLGIKSVEYAVEFCEGLAPVFGAPFTYDGPDPLHAELFFSLYFAMTVCMHCISLAASIVSGHAGLVATDCHGRPRAPHRGDRLILAFR